MLKVADRHCFHPAPRATIMRILLADNQTRVRFALRTLLQQQPGIEVTAEASDAATLLERVIATCPDLILLDWGLPGLEPAALMTALRQVCPGLRVIVLSGRPEAEGQAMAIGADGFVSKGYPPENLLAVIGWLQVLPAHSDASMPVAPDAYNL